LKLIAGPQSNIQVVDELFVSHCISYKTIMDAKQPCYRVKGYGKEMQSGSTSKEVEQTTTASPLAIKQRRSREERTPSPEPYQLPAYAITTGRRTANDEQEPEQPQTPSTVVDSENEFSIVVKEAKSLNHLVRHP
jgi:hypothetical protein